MESCLRLIIAFLALCVSWSAASASDRVALIVGNSRYLAVGELANPTRDAALVKQSLIKAGFAPGDVISITDGDKQSIERALREFGVKARDARVAFVYFAGHGIEIGGQNYLIPIDAQLAQDRDADLEAIRLDTVLNVSEGARLSIVVLDACRNNPFVSTMTRTLKTRSVGRGLAEVEPETDTLVVYATRAGAVALDGDGANSPFAAALARRLPEQNVEVNMLFRRVRDDVLATTEGAQNPFTYGSLSGQEFYFVPGKAITEEIRKDPVQVEALMWQGALSAQTKGAFSSYLTRFPSGIFADQARENLKRFEIAPASTKDLASVRAEQVPGEYHQSLTFFRQGRLKPAEIQKTYGAKIHPMCNAVVRDNYPFSRRSSTTISQLDFLAVFGSGGPMDQMVNGQLSRYLDRTGDFWQWTESSDTALLDPATPDTLFRAAQLRDMVTDGLSFTLELDTFGKDVNYAIVQMGDKVVRLEAYNNSAVPIVWSLGSNSPVQSIAFYSGNGLVKEFKYEGAWALFQLIDQARLQSLGPGKFRALFSEAQRVFGSINIRLPSNINPFAAGNVFAFRCPEQL